MTEKRQYIKHSNFIACPWCNPEAPRASCSLCHGTAQVPHPDEQLCNMCGGYMCHERTNKYGKWKADSPHGLYEQTVFGGYESYHLFDMTAYTFSLCEECLRKMFLQFKIKPVISNLEFGSYPDDIPTIEIGDSCEWQRDLEAYDYRIWHDNGGHHQAYLNKKCNQKKDCPNNAIYTVWLNDHFTEDSSCEEHKDRWKNSVSAKLVPFITNVFKPFL